MHRLKKFPLLLTSFAFYALAQCTCSTSHAGPPNIVNILADDLGYGDVKSFGNDLSRIETPYLDKLSSEGMRFTDAHSPSSVCTPTRYSLLTGRYSWRSQLKRGVLRGYSPPLIKESRSTVAHFLKTHGYSTACIGKWHLGMDMPTKDGKPPYSRMTSKDHDKPLDPSKCNVDWKGQIKHGPTARGFEYIYGISASLDMPPYIWIKDDHFVGECTTAKAFHRSGPAHKDFLDSDVLPIITEKACEYIVESSKKDKPFFLYVPLTSPHTPISPSKAFQGKTGLGRYADFVMETDWSVGQIVESIDKSGLGQKTLVIVTSDNGCSPAASARAGQNSLNLTFNGPDPLAPQKDHHYASGIYRGHKADIYEGGHRVPFIARWPNKIEKGSECSETICLLDLYATCADLLRVKLRDNEAEDSVSTLQLMLGKKKSSQRDHIVHHSINGSFALRRGPWKLIFCPDSGGWSDPRPGQTNNDISHQLYNLSQDPAETINLYTEENPIAAELIKAMKQIIVKGRSTEGVKQSNDGDVELYQKTRKR